MKKTALHSTHLNTSGKMVDFHGWEMPLHYGSQLKEHELVRSTYGMFDISHMTIIDVLGVDSREYLRLLLANDVNKLEKNFDALLSVFLNQTGGVIDDLLVYRMEDGYRLVVNCATRETVLSWMRSHLNNLKVSLRERKDLSMLAFQGPKTFKILTEILPLDLIDKVRTLSPFQGVYFDQRLITTTGYTGERGVEIITTHEDAEYLWKKALLAGVSPIGLAARDTLRLEAGMNLYGFEMDETISPLESNMAWTVCLNDEERDFIGKDSYLSRSKENFHVLKGLVFEDKCIVRSNQEIFFEGNSLMKGVVTSGTYSPTLKKSIALARIPISNLKKCLTNVRGKEIKALIGSPKFVKEGTIIFKKG